MPYNRFPDAFQMRQKMYLFAQLERVSIKSCQISMINLSRKDNTSKSKSILIPSAW